MNNLAVYHDNKVFDFVNNKVETLDLETLKRTYKENDINGNPLMGLYHYQVIEQVADLCRINGLNYEIEDIFAAQNRNRQTPGVVILPQAEEIFGEKAIEAHVLRRVFTTLKIRDDENEETNTTICVAFHQDGIQMAIGPNVKICHNQCILSADRRIYNYGKDKVSNEEMFAVVNNWLENFAEYRIHDLHVLEEMKKINCSVDDCYKLIGLLTSMRVAKDSANKNLSSLVNVTPLNQAQITQFTEKCLLAYRNRSNLTLWDVYNLATELYKPTLTEIPNLIPQNLSLMETIINYYGL